nr:MAG TPA: hypothetical protein [Caudoviricetes sp.]
MMLINVKLQDGDSILTRINGSLEDVARYYFPRKEVKEIKILNAAENRQEFTGGIQIPTRIYRATKEEIEEFQLFNNIRYEFSVIYTENPEWNEKRSCGLCRI